jgi:RHS repeat-associated protein
LNLTYNYSATSGQMGSGSTAGNAGQLMNISGTISGTTESAAYTYDNRARLVTSNQTSNGSSAQRRFEYDRWGNRTAVWDATSSGEQIQGIGFDQSGGTPTNRIAASTPASLASLNTPGQCGTPTTLFVNGKGRYVRVQLGGANVLSVAELQVLAEDGTNLALSKSTSQTSTGSGGVSSRAVDGNTNGDWSAGSVTQTNLENQPWLEVDLAENQEIQEVKVWNRTDCCSDRLTNFNVIVSNEPITSYSYDAAGGVINDGAHTYSYDSENRLVSVDGGATATYAYDHQNRRYKKTVGSSVTHCVWQDSEVIAEHNGSTGAVLVDYIFSADRMLARLAGGSASFFLSDRLSIRAAVSHLGSVIGRQAHLPFGEDFAETGTQDKHHFTNYERDSESGTDYATNRQYDFAHGRFLTPDPERESAQNSYPESWNRYSYAWNDSINLTDPTGLTTCAIGVRKHGDSLAGIYGSLPIGSTPGPFTNGNFYAYLLEPIFAFSGVPPGVVVFYSVSLELDVNLTYRHNKKRNRSPIFDVRTINDGNLAFTLQPYHVPGPQSRVTTLLYLPSVINRKWRDNPKFRLTFNPEVSSASFDYLFVGYDEFHREKCRARVALVFNLGVLHPNGFWEYFSQGVQ